MTACFRYLTAPPTAAISVISHDISYWTHSLFIFCISLVYRCNFQKSIFNLVPSSSISTKLAFLGTSDFFEDNKKMSLNATF